VDRPQLAGRQRERLAGNADFSIYGQWTGGHAGPVITLAPYPAKTMSADNIVRIDGGPSPFYVKRTGYLREVGFCYFYGDARYQFFFYVDPTRGPDGLIFTVAYATGGRLEGSVPKIAEADLAGIEGNITRLFFERDWTYPEKPVRDEHRPAEVVFTWANWLDQARLQLY
jgi:hypothetical protein